MAGMLPTTKRLAISKANAQVVAVVAIAAFVTVFCLIAAKTVFSQNQYQSRVTKEKEKAHKQLQENLAAYSSLVESYKKFDSQTTNVIGGTRSGSTDNDGSNSKIILDALPSTYDFPALASSIEKIMTDQSLKVNSITGTDDQVNQQNNTSSPSPQSSPIPFTFSIKNASYEATQKLISALQRSIRPMAIDSVKIGGAQNDMTITVTVHTYYQPAKSVSITKKVVK